MTENHTKYLAALAAANKARAVYAAKASVLDGAREDLRKSGTALHLAECELDASRQAYEQEVSSAGTWDGNGPVPQ